MRIAVLALGLFIFTFFIQQSTLLYSSGIDLASIANSAVIGQLKDNLSADRKTDLETLQKNMLKYLLEGTYLSDSEKLEQYRNAEHYFDIQIEKFANDILKEMSGEKVPASIEAPPQWTLKSEVEYLNDLAKDVKSTIDPELKATFKDVVLGYDIEGLDISVKGDDNQKMLNDFITILKSGNNEEDKVLTLFRKFEERLDPVIGKIRSLGTELAKSGKLKHESEMMNKFLQEFIDFYYQNTDLNVIKSIMSDLASLGHIPTEDETARAMFANADPSLGKMLQQLGRDPKIGGEIKEMFEQFESDNKKVPFYMVEDIVNNDTGEFKFKSIKKKGHAGTVAQFHKAVLVQKGEELEVGLRVLKPGIIERGEEGIRVLKEFLSYVKSKPELNEVLGKMDLQKMVESVERFLFLDMDIPGTVKRQIEAGNYYEKGFNIKLENRNIEIKTWVPGVFEPPSGNSGIQVMELITDGIKFSEMTDSIAQKEVAKKITELWFEEAIFKSGFFHGDLHQGNFFVVLNKEKDLIEIFFLDYGMAMVVPKRIRRGFMLISTGAILNDAQLLTKGMVASSGKEVSKKEFNRIKGVIKEKIRSGSFDMQQWIFWGAQNGFIDDPDLGTLARGQMLVTQIPELLGLNDLKMSVVKKLAAKEGVKKLFLKSKSYPLTFSDLLSIGFRAGKAGCSNLYRKFFTISDI